MLSGGNKQTPSEADVVMESKTGIDAFTRTRSTWMTLTVAGLLWVGACVWAFSAVEFDVRDDSVNGNRPAAQALDAARLAQVEAEEKARLDAQAAAAEQRQKAAEVEAAKQARLALEAEEQTRLEAQGKAAERRRLAAAEEAELEALKARELAEQKARRADAAQELARQDAQAKATDARQRAARGRKNTGIDEQARQAAAAEASRIAALARQQRSVVSSVRDQELGVLSELSSRLQFAAGSAAVSRQTERILDDIFNPLYLYSELFVLVAIATNEYDGTTRDGLLSRDRGRAIASYLINRGLDKERFRIYIESGEDLAAGTHRVRVSAEEVRE